MKLEMRVWTIEHDHS